MSIASDIRAYADSAVGQGKATLSNAQASLNDIAGKANGAVNDLRVSAERAVNIDAIRSAIEPYLAQVKGYGTTVTDRADVWIGDLKGDPRIAKLVDSANSLSGVVLETVQERVVKPVQSLTGVGAKKTATRPTTTARTSAPKAASKPAARKTASTKPAPATAAKSTARKSTAKRTTTDTDA